MFVLFCFALGQSVQTTTDPSFRINIYPPSRDKWVSGHLAAGKVFEETKLNFVKRLLSEPPKPVKVVDVGAHIGSFSLYVAALGHQVIAVEPLPDSVDLLNESIQENRFGNLIELYQAALTDKSQVKAGSVCMRSDPTNIGHTFVAGIDLRFENQPCHSASLITLDQLVEGQTDIYLLKIDVEGFEKRVFLGGKKFFKTGAPCVVLLEYSPIALMHAGTDPVEFLNYITSTLPYEMYLEEGLHGPFPKSSFSKFAEEVTKLEFTNLVLKHKEFEKCVARFGVTDSTVFDPSRVGQMDEIKLPNHRRDPDAPPIQPVKALHYTVTPAIPAITPPPTWERKEVTEKQSSLHTKILIVGTALSAILVVRGLLA
eukprot:c8576_g1_i2.p1 GENE.c8576_g1_i2~~c8576_g1_i2.p1  ORF type:complete len:370 (+),score=92.76 c8576_g1_i2:21-1130(+)